jgi:glucuronate isomerase
MTDFINDDFLLQNDIAKKLYHEFAENMPIYDYHCHLPVLQIVENHNFENLTQIWLYGDHYKWRTMRANGIGEKYITGNASDYEKFEKWASTVPQTLRNPLHHWTHLELKRYFGVDELLNFDTAKDIYDHCSNLLKKPEFNVQNLLRKMNVKLICTTQELLDNLEGHKKLKQQGFDINVHAAFRPDAALTVENSKRFNQFLGKLEEVSDMRIKTFDDLLEAVKDRHDYFHENGCRLSDYSLETAYAQDYTQNEIKTIFDKIRKDSELNLQECLKLKSAMMYEFALMDHQKGWAMQLHLGALRNNNTRMLNVLGPDAGFDSMGDFEIARPLAQFLDKLDVDNKLPKTIIYNLNPRDNELIATMIGNFQDGTVPGKLQYGPAWWFLDQKNGIERQIEVLSNLGLLGRFIGMLTDSRSFLSFTRHEYFRRILCNIFGNDVQMGLLPDDISMLGEMIKNICYFNARNYFEKDY